MTTNNAINAPLPLAISQGGTGQTSQSNALTALLGSSTVPIANGGTGATTQGDALTAILGSSSIGVANGGTGAATLTDHGIVISHGTSALTSTALTNGQLLIGSTGNNPSAATLTAGVGISITNDAGSITVNATGSGIAWNTTTGTSATLAANNGYIATNSSLTTYTLPTAATVGDTFEVLSTTSNAAGWKIAQNSGQQIRFGENLTTTGTGGYLQSAAVGDTVTLICIDGTTSNEIFQVTDSIGNITVN